MGGREGLLQDHLVASSRASGHKVRKHFRRLGYLRHPRRYNDIHMCNVIIGDDGRVWLIDWDWAGFYPEYFEFLAMTIAAEDPANAAQLSWRYCVPFIADPFFGRRRWLVGLPP